MQLLHDFRIPRMFTGDLVIGTSSSLGCPHLYLKEMIHFSEMLVKTYMLFFPLILQPFPIPWILYMGTSEGWTMNARLETHGRPWCTALARAMSIVNLVLASRASGPSAQSTSMKSSLWWHSFDVHEARWWGNVSSRTKSLNFNPQIFFSLCYSSDSMPVWSKQEFSLITLLVVN